LLASVLLAAARWVRGKSAAVSGYRREPSAGCGACATRRVCDGCARDASQSGCVMGRSGSMLTIRDEI
jgi:hypothetical protein